MNVIITSNNGILDTPILIQEDLKAETVFDEIVENLLKEDYTEIKYIIDYDYKYNEAKRLLEGTGNDIHWFIDLIVE